MKTIQKQFRGDVGSCRRSKAIIPIVLSLGEHKCALNNAWTHTHILSNLWLVHLSCCKDLPKSPRPAYNLFYAWYILYFSPAVTSSQLDGQIWTDIIGLYISAVRFQFWFGWIETRQLVRKKEIRVRQTSKAESCFHQQHPFVCTPNRKVLLLNNYDLKQWMRKTTWTMGFWKAHRMALFLHQNKNPNWIFSVLTKNKLKKKTKILSAVLFGLTKMFSVIMSYKTFNCFLPAILIANTLHSSNALLFLVSAAQLFGVWKHFSDSVVSTEARTRPTHRTAKHSQANSGNDRF